ncbi:TPA: hypothetical protein HA241_07875 [Candidatus Woesearchaeota archaeon]|nr:hypothetical protein [Candidatus Woesearchaeota archaeon]
MSLDDKFNPSDGSLIDTIDVAFFRFNRRIAVYWQDKTHASKTDLETILYLGSAVAFGTFVTQTVLTQYYYLGVLNLFPAIDSLRKGIIQSARPRSGLEEEIVSEVSGVSPKISKFWHVFNYGLGAVVTVGAIGYLAYGLLSGDHGAKMESLYTLSLSMGILGWTSADYMAKSDIGAPPPKPKKEPLVDRFMSWADGLLPKPSLEPHYASMHSEI